MQSLSVHPDPEISGGIKRAARWFGWRNPQFDPDEIMAEASLIGMEAARAFDGRGNRASFVAWVVRRRLLKLLGNDSWCRRMLRQEHHRLKHPELYTAPAATPGLYTLLEECTRDAREVVHKCVDDNIRTAATLFANLRALGWRADRISAVFEEIRESLS